MDTLLYVGQIVAGAILLVVGLAWSGPSRTHVGTSSTSVTEYGDAEVDGKNSLLGVLLALAAIGFGVTGLAGLPVLPAPVGVLITGFGLMSVLLAADTTPTSYHAAVDEVSVIPVPRTSAEVIGIPSRTRPETADRHAA